MGVPLFFGWLRRKYPGIVTEIIDMLAEDGVHCAGSAQVCAFVAPRSQRVQTVPALYVQCLIAAVNLISRPLHNGEWVFLPCVLI